MADFKIPYLNKKSDKSFFKKKLTLRRKSKRKLIKESLFMFLFSVLIIYLNYLIPNKHIIFKNFFSNFEKIIIPLRNLITYFNEICVVLFMIFSMLVALILIIGATSRLLKVLKRKSRKISTR